MAGQLIAVEGIDGAGCGTQTALLAEYLSQTHDVETYTYPDYSHPIGTFLKRFLNEQFDLQSPSEFLVYCADMAKDLDHIREQLAADTIVICDRYLTTTLAYQSVNGIDISKMEHFAKLFAFPPPDLAIYLDISAETSQERKEEEKDELDRYEKDTAYREKVRSAYTQLVDEGVFAQQWITVNAELPIQEVQDQVQKAVADALAL